MSGRNFVIITLLFLPTVSTAQTCVDNIKPTFITGNYQITDNGTVQDLQRNIEWRRCLLGQVWRNNNCQGKPKLVTWSKARDTAKQQTGWRLPTLHELGSITELSCHHPAINSQYFPNTDSLWFWTETEFVNNRELVWQMYFGSGENRTAKKATEAAVRLVRSIKIRQR